MDENEVVLSNSSITTVNDADTDGIPSRSSDAETSKENKENEPPARNPKQWFEGVVGRPVAFKAISRRSSRN